MKLELIRLLQLVSPTLPVGAFAYSQGMESAVEHGLVNDEAATRDWVQGILQNNIGRLDLPALKHQMLFCIEHDKNAMQTTNDRLLAFRETAEFRAESIQLAKALGRLLRDMGVDLSLLPDGDVDWVTTFAMAACSQNIQIDDAMLGYAWAWCENQIAAAIKLVPLGQTQGQRLLHQLGESVIDQVAISKHIKLEEMGAIAPYLAILSAQHETQYSRLFRS